MLGLAVYENGVCACGFHESQIDPETLHVTFDEKVCPVCAGADAYGRYQAKRDQEFDKGIGPDASAKVARPADGRRTYIRQMSADEVAEATARQGRRTPAVDRP